MLTLAENKLRDEQWSPQQISAWMKINGQGAISHETIYQHVYRDKKAAGKLHTHLRHRCKSYRKRGLEREQSGHLKD